MKIFYMASIILGLMTLAVFNLVTIAPAQGSHIAYPLNREPTKWEIEIVEEDFHFRSEEEMKEGILTFMQSNLGNEYDDVTYGTVVGLTFIFFGGMGFYREFAINRKPKSDQGGVSNG